jgi:PAS domain S-box-containing protein
MLSRTRLERWVSQVQNWWEAIRSPIAQSLGGLDADERRRVGRHALALAAVAGAVGLRAAFADGSSPSSFWLFHVAVAITAVYGGAAAALVATLAAFLAARVGGGVALSAGLLFGVEALLLTAVIIRLTRLVQHQRQRMATVEAWLVELKSSERQGRLVDVAFSRLDEASGDTALLVLDRAGRILDWRAGATRLYGCGAAEVLGTSAATLFEDLPEDAFARLVAEARAASAREAGRQRRADGTTFSAEVEIRPLSRGGFDGFTMVVRDLTRQQARDAAATSSAQAYAELREEADTAQQQLWTLQHVTDPSLNSLGGTDFVTTLLDRLRTSIDAEGIALVHLGQYRRRVFCASGGVQCQRGIQRPPIDLRSADPARTLIIHNDPQGVAELSAAGWPDGVSSLIAVPVVRGGSKQAVMEVVNRAGRRATEWEIALAQVVAARIAGFLQDDPYADTGAVA